MTAASGGCLDRRPAQHQHRGDQQEAGRAAPGHRGDGPRPGADPPHRRRRAGRRGGHRGRQRRQPRSTRAASSPSSSATSAAQSRIDAQIRVGGDAGASEVVVLRLYGALTEHGRSVVIPLLLPDSPVVAWWPTDAPAKVCRGPDRLDGPAPHHRRRGVQEPARRRSRRAPAAYSRGDTDLAWTRVTLWRGLLAAALDQPPFEPVTEATVTGGSDSPSTDLLAAWLALTLRCPVRRARSRTGTGMVSVRLERTQRCHRPGPPGRLDRHPEPARAAGPPDLAGPARHRRVPRRRAAPTRPRRDLRGDHPQRSAQGRHASR